MLQWKYLLTLTDLDMLFIQVHAATLTPSDGLDKADMIAFCVCLKRNIRIPITHHIVKQHFSPTLQTKTR